MQILQLMTCASCLLRAVLPQSPVQCSDACYRGYFCLHTYRECIAYNAFHVTTIQYSNYHVVTKWMDTPARKQNLHPSTEPEGSWTCPQNPSFNPVTAHFIAVRVFIHSLSTVDFDVNFKFAFIFSTFSLALRFSKQIIVWISFISIRVPFNLSYFIY